MKIVKSIYALLVAAGCCSTPYIAQAYQLTREEADVRLIGSIPAICLPQKAWRSFPVSYVMMMESQTLQAGRWAIELKDDAEPMKLRPGNCISYGSMPDGYQHDPAEGGRDNSPLSLNTIYYFRMVRRIPILWYMPTAIYEATFCLKEDADGAVSIQKESACPDSSR
ncbi:hypothetical protein ACJ7C5_00090 [Nocardiopsis yanglingensis]